MDELLTAIADRFDSVAGNALRAILTGGMWQGRAKEGATPPYVTVSVPTSFTDDSMSTELISPLVQFSIFSGTRTPLAAYQAAEALRSLYRHVSLTVAGWNCVSAIVEQPGIAVQDDADSTWAVHVQIRYVIGK